MQRAVPILITIIMVCSVFVISGEDSISKSTSEIPTRGADHWTMDMPVMDAADASFHGEGYIDEAGFVTKAGDINGDGLNDILISVPQNDEGGKVYLIFGRRMNWPMKMNLSNADASFSGFGGSLETRASGVGDVNSDGYDDILLGSAGHRSLYLVFGRPSEDLTRDMTTASADVTFHAEAGESHVGEGHCGAGDVNGDGYDDILIGDYLNGEGGPQSGQAYLVFGRETSNWPISFELGNSDASFIGDGDTDNAGKVVAGGGDINGDGYDDILISSFILQGAYVFFGRESGWSMDTLLSNADASFMGEWECKSLDSSGDFNNDGFSDILLGYPFEEVGGFSRGKTYLILGKESGWSRGIIISEADVVFNGEADEDSSGWSVSNAGDVNKDGYDDILIGALFNDENVLGSGQVYLIYGKDFDQSSSIILSESDASFLGQGTRHFLGASVAGLGDVDGDMVDDFILAGPHSQSEYDGLIYLVLGISSTEPLSVNSVKIYSNLGFSTEVEMADLNDLVYVELIGEDGNASTWDSTFINILFSESEEETIQLRVKETGSNTGIYRGAFRIPVTSEYLETVTFTSRKDPSKSDTITINTDVLIGPFYDIKTATEDSEYREEYWNDGWSDQLTWTVNIDKDWLQFDQQKLELHGIPDNGDVGSTLVSINLTDNHGNYDVHNFIISVENVAPIMTGEDIIAIDQNEFYKVDYDCDDDGQGNVTYYVTTEMDWLEIGRYDGILSGTPDNDDVGTSTVQVSVHDGNEGWDSREFLLMVSNVNDAPVIITEDITQVTQDDPFVRNYVAEDVDDGDELRWKLHTNAGFLSIDEEKGTLTGTPSYQEVGSFFVNVSVWDLSDDYDFHNFTLEVANINDLPVWTDFPDNADVPHGQTFLFDVNTVDYDGNLVTYYISSEPKTDIVIDEFTGSINWTADIHLFEEDPYELRVKVTARDGLGFSNRSFTITVVPSDPPVVELLEPSNGAKGASTGAVLRWEGTDPENEPITYNIYLHQTQAYIQGLREEALFEEDYEGLNITLDALTPGRTYFWTVIPNDGCSYGTCISGVMSFRVNYKPTFKALEDQKVSADADLKYKISATDEDSEDLPNLRYSLIEAPEGMTISEETGMIRWTPSKDQVLLHMVTVGVTDGIEMNTATFEIDVTEGEESSSSLAIIIVIMIVIIIVILIAIGIYMFIRIKKKVDEKALKKGEEERAALEKEKEGETTSYEELYGAPAPAVEEEKELTTQELRDSIHEQIEKLEQIETKK